MKTSAKLRLAAMILCALALSSCGEKVRVASLPADLTECKAEPNAPDLPAQDWSSLEAAKAIQATRDVLMLDYVLGLRSWAGDCEAALKGVKAWSDTVGGR